MNKFKKITAILLVLAAIAGFAVLNVSAANSGGEETGATANQIIVHVKNEGSVPNIYYWNSLPQNIEVAYPGKAMTLDANEGSNWYTYKFDASITKINMLFINGSKQSEELTRNTGEWWYKDNKWTGYNPEKYTPPAKTDFREETIYFVMTTRFYDGDTGNNVHCWDDKQANNPDSDPAWRGDFKGLIDKLDYIKALGFSAIWVTPVVSNASGYDFHGYHAFDFSTVDPRYESSGATYQDLIDAVHLKGMKIIQDVVVNHTGNFGEAFFAPMFEKQFNSIQDLANIDSMKVLPNSGLPANYLTLDPGAQFQARLAIMKNTDGLNHDTKNYYHHSKDMSWEQPSEQTGQIAGDCVDMNTENPAVAEHFQQVYGDYIAMGVDSFRLDTEKHVSRLSLNMQFFPGWLQKGGKNFFIFGEVCTRVSEVWNHMCPADSAPFYTWAESKDWGWSSTDAEKNLNLSLSHWEANKSVSTQPTSTNAKLNGNDYHTPDYSLSNGTAVIDFPMHWNFGTATGAFRMGKENDQVYNDATWNVTYVDSHDYGPNTDNRYAGGTAAWAENLALMFTFRGIPCIYYGSEVEFMKGARADIGPNGPLSTTGRAYFGDYITGSVKATGFGTYENATGKVAETLNSPLAKHLQKLSQIRRAIPALQKGQYSTEGVQGEMSFKRRYTDTASGVDSFVCVTITNAATFSGIPNGTYTDAVTGDVKVVTNGTLTMSAPGQGNMRAYVLDRGGSNKISGAIGGTGAYLK